MENKKVLSLDEKMDVIIHYLSSINYLLLYGDKVNKNDHFEELNKRTGAIQSTSELLESDQIHAS